VGPFLLAISARGAGALTELARRYEACLADVPAPIGDICRAAALRRGHYEERIAVVGSTAEALRDALRDAAAGTSRLGVSRGSGTEDAGVVFVCSGQGSQWAGMGAQLMRREPAFRDAIEECETSVQRYGGWSITRELEADESASRLAHTEFAQPAIVAIEIAIARLWQSWGITPSAVIGHSVGEIAAAHIAGIIELDEAMRIAVLRGRLMERATGTGRMAAIFANAHEIEADLAEFGGALSLAAINGPQSVVASGDASAVEALVERCRARNIASRPLGVDYAFHSTQMEPFAGALARELGTVAVRRSTIPMISTVTGDVIAGDTLDAAYWGRNIRQTVRFADATMCALTMNVGLFVEVGPHPVLAVSVQECVAAAGGTASAIASLRRQQDERSTMLASLATLYARGASVDWSAVYPGPSAVVDLPAYPYQRDRHWIRRAAAASVASSWRRPMLEQRVRSPLLAGDGFESRISLATHPYLADHRIGGSVILPMTGFVELVLEAIAEASGATAIVLEDVVVQRPIVLAGDHARTVQVLLEGAGFRVFGLEGERWELCATGRFHSAVTDVANAAPEVSGEPRDPSAHYRHAATRGAEFGPAFQTVVELRASDETAAATVRLAGSERAKGYQIHPTLLDGCFQTVLAAGRDGGSWVPIAIDRLEIVAPADSEVRSILRTRPRDADSQTLTADLWVSTPAGRSIAVVTGLRLAPMVAPAQGASRFAYVTRWRSRDRGEARRAGDAPGRWLILGDNAGIGPELRSALETRGQACAFMASSAPAESPALDGLRGVIVIEGDAPNIASTTAAARRVVREALELVQRVARGPGDAPELWFLTRGAVAAVPNDDVGGLSQSPVLGLARSIAIELPDFKCATIDISDATDASSVAAEILDSDGEDRVAFRGGIRYVPRLEPVAATSAPAERRLAIPARGSIDGLTFEPLHRRAPGAGEIEVAVGAASLNFRDVMNVLDMYPGDAGPLGVEFVGCVARVGDGVSSWQPGDRVMGIAWGSFATHVTTPAS
jgi:acyl transferase domain-containing protein